MTGVVAGRERGETRIADRVVAAIAARAAEDNADTREVDRTVLGMPVGGTSPARVDVSVRGEIVTARVQVAVAYPRPVREVTRRVRERVRDQVESMTGLTVHNIDIDVAALDRPVPEQRAARRPVEVL
ncbi:Asp23/Gls24 family envelope stress response protein [Spirillospora sp. NPDC127200]